jgi:2'-5' RNA ligase
MTEKIRAFLSVDIEDNTLLSKIGEIQGKLDKSAMKIKTVERDNIHFTLRFFGDTEIARIKQIHETLSKIQLASFQIQIEGIGAFPTPRRPRVIWVGVTQGEDYFNQLKSEIETGLKSIGYKPDKRFHAHATIARVRAVKDRESVINNLESLTNEPVGAMQVSNFRMTKSTLTSSGPIYETVWEISLH